MPRSKIIKELANGTVDTLIALKRTKVLLTEFDNVELNTWINNELKLPIPKMGFAEGVK